VWRELAATWPWLRSSDATILELACVLVARLRSGDLGVSQMHLLSSVLSKCGGSPADVSKVAAQKPQEPDPADEFFADQGGAIGRSAAAN
jgi:hypothetical protein